MLAGILERPGRCVVAHHPIPELAHADDVRIAVELAGVCGTDLHIADLPQRHPARTGIVLGHEIVGRVVERGSAVHGLTLGQRVVAGPNIWCGQCDACRAGARKFCTLTETLGITRDGGFAEFVVGPARAWYPVPAGTTPELAVLAEPLSCILNGVHKLGAVHGECIVVLGAGPIGLLFVRLLRHLGARQVLVSEPVPARCAAALACGATAALAPPAAELGRAAIVVDTTGFLLDDALALLRPGGKVLVFGLDTECACTVRPFQLARHEQTVHGCFIDNDLIPRCLDLIPDLGLEGIATERFALADLADAFEAVRSARGLKSLVYPKGLQ